MKNLFRFLYLIVSFSIFGIGTPEALAQAPCSNVDVSGSPSIVLIGGTYYYSVPVNNSGPAFTSGVDISVNTTNFTVANLPSQNINSGPNTLLFEITSDVADIPTNPVAFGAATYLTYPGGTPAPCADTTIAIISTAGWGCTDPTAINYNPLATFDNNTCLDNICDLLALVSVQIVYNGGGVPVLQLTVVNNSPFNIPFGSTITPNITGSTPPFAINNGIPNSLIVPAGGFVTLEFPIISDINDLVGNFLFITGGFSINVPSIPDMCDVSFTSFPINISNLGCTDPTAYNFDIHATVDNGTCVNNISVTQNIIQPICVGDPGSVEFSFEGGTPPFTVDYGLQDPDHLLPGNYTFVVTDNTDTTIGGPITQVINVSIEYPDIYEVNIALDGNTTLIAAVNGDFTGWYYWLLDGVVVDSTQVPFYVYTTPGVYTCYVETPVNALGQQCWDYSNGILLTQIGTEEWEKQGLGLYPNPNKGNFTVTVDNFTSNEISAQIFDVQGKEVYRVQSNEFDGKLLFDNVNLEPGVYQIRMENGDKLYRSKVVVQ